MPSAISLHRLWVTGGTLTIMVFSPPIPQSPTRSNSPLAARVGADLVELLAQCRGPLWAPALPAERWGTSGLIARVSRHRRKSGILNIMCVGVSLIASSCAII